MSSLDGPVLLYDGVCGFCDRAVRLVLRLDRRGLVRFATLQGETAREIRARHPRLGGADSLVLVEPSGSDGERVLTRSEAALGVARVLGWPWCALGALRVVPRSVRDAAYDLFARYRYRLFGHYEECRVPSPDIRSRFLD